MNFKYGKYEVIISEHENDYMFQVRYAGTVGGIFYTSLCACFGWRKTEEQAILNACKWIDENG